MKCLEITTAIPCRNNCSYCPQDKLLKKYKGVRKLNLFTFLELLDKLPKTVKLHFSGFCEPFQNEQTINMIWFAHQKGYRIGLYTTTIGLDHASIEILRGINIDPFYVHLPQKHFEKKWLKNVAWMIRQDLNFKFIQVGSVQSDKVKGIIKKRDVEFQKIISRAGNLNNDFTYFLGPVQCKDKRYNQNVLLPNGDIVLCCQDYGLEYKLGNILLDGYEGICKSKVYEKVMKDLTDDRNDLICRKCFRCVRSK